MDRRKFLVRATTGTVGVAAAVRRESYASSSPNETINVAVVGIRGDNKGHPTWTSAGKGQDHYEALAGLPNVRISHVVDIDERHFSTTLPLLQKQFGGNPKTETDLRRVLDNPEVDAITVAVPDHWHALATIWACQAGKDVYVEKPVCHNIIEGRRMVEAARKYNRVVNAGTQRRSNPLIKQAADFLREGRLGKIHTGKCCVYRSRDPIGTYADSSLPSGVHYDIWQGPAPNRPFNENRFHYHWHWQWDYGTGELGNNGIHVLDMLRWTTDRKEHPRKIYSTGGLYERGAATDQQTPNIQYTVFEYADGVKLHCDVRGWFTEPADEGVSIYGSEGWMKVTQQEVKVYLGRKNEPGPQIGAGNGSESRRDRHFANFIECMRSRKWQNLNAEIEQAYMSTALCHLGNISFRVGRLLEFAGDKERFVGDAEADKLLGREYRAPFVVPKVV